MKIIRICGENLASLAEPFDIDFEAVPLAGAGLFAISGPTGAGKSTLLDAMCLALFDRTPRLSDRGGAPIGRDDEKDELRLASNDVRSVLRRGASEGFAQVVFLGRDGRRYEATWRCYRARRRVDGRLQAQTVTLRDVAADQLLGEGKRDTLERIVEKLGLTFDQFCRSVLLAQGDFAAFLRAEPEQRAELLEKMTGTEIYREISIAAHERARAEKERLATLEARREGQPPLTPEAREALEKETAEARALVEQAKQRFEAAKRAVSWFETLVQLQAAEGEAVLAEEKARATLEAAEPIRLALAEAEAAEPFRPLVQALDGAAAELQAAQSELVQAREQEATAQRLWSEQSALLDASVTALRAAETKQTEAEPQLQQARTLDGELKAAREKLREAQEAAACAASERTEAAQQAEAIAGEIAALEQRLESAERWLANHHTLEPLVTSWERAKQDLRHLYAARRSLLKAIDRREENGRTSEAAHRSLLDARSAENEARSQVDAVQTALSDAREQLAAVDAEGLRSRRAEADRRRTVLTSLEGLVTQALQERVSLEAARRKGENAGAAVKAADEALRALEPTLEGLRGELRAEQRLLERAKASLALDERRGLLVEGEPCPLCGSEEHPYAGDARFSELVQAGEARVSALQAEIEAGHKEATRLASHRAAQASIVEESRSRAGDSEQALAKLDEAYRLDRQRLPDGNLPSALEEVSEVGGFVEARRAAETELDDISTQEKALGALTAKVESLQRQADQLARQLEGASASVRRNEQEVSRLATEAATIAGEVRQHEESFARLKEELDAVFAARHGWLELFEKRAETFVAGIDAEIAGWVEQKKAAEDAGRALAESRPKLAAAQALVAKCAQSAESLEHASLQAAQASAEVEARRRALLGGRPVAEVEAEIRKAVESARRREAEARGAAETSAGKLALARGRREAAEAETTRRTETEETARARLDEALSSSSLALEALRERLSRDAAWKEGQRSELERRRGEVGRASAVLAERRSQRERHENAERPEVEADAAALLRDEAQASLEVAERTCADGVAALRMDDANRTRAAEIQQQIDALLPTVERWRTVADLIGSSDGKKFVLFAQSLTLDALLGEANRHMSQLARRYRLQRVPGRHLDLQVVDLELGDEVRSINSLSGGESFLVSLALALGLSSFSARDARIESLFIDEGFGTLDPDTLDVALATLDALQASGRQVGLISHVSGLAERIGVQVRVEPLSVGRSRVRAVGIAA